MATPLPTAVAPSKIVTVLPDSAVPTEVAVATLVMLSVLDDPLSALDVDTEALVEAALRRVLASTTALIVAHRPSTVMLADRVALLEDGRITAVGTHSSLLATNEHYRFVISSLEDDEEEEELEEVNL